MPTVAFTVPASTVAGPAQGRKQVTITAPAVSGDPITLPITSPKVDITPGIVDWVETPRPFKKSLLLPRGVKLSTMKMTVQVVGANPDDVDGCELILQRLALMSTVPQPGNPLVVSYGRWESSHALCWTGGWRLTAFTITSQKRQPVTNSILWAEVSLTFTEASDVPLPAGLLSRTAVPPAPTPAPAAPGAAPGTKPAAGRTYTVRTGDTLWGISVRFYGSGARWTAIAQANGIADPRSLHPGQVLKIP